MENHERVVRHGCSSPAEPGAPAAGTAVAATQLGLGEIGLHGGGVLRAPFPGPPPLLGSLDGQLRMGTAGGKQSGPGISFRGAGVPTEFLGLSEEEHATGPLVALTRHQMQQGPRGLKWCGCEARRRPSATGTNRSVHRRGPAQAVGRACLGPH